MCDEELMNTYESGHNSCDGVIRPGTFWDEEFSSADYRLSLTPLPYLRLSGFGGEQYRNMERLPLKSLRSYRSWVRWDMIYRFAGHHFKDKRTLRKLEDRIILNLKTLLGKNFLNLITFKEYRRQVLVVSYRSFQTNMENRYGFLVSPLADANLSIPARSAYPYMAKSLQFQIDMLKEVSIDLASLRNTHGFNFLQGEPWKRRFGIKLWQVGPSSIKHKLFAKLNKYYRSDFIALLIKQSPFIDLLIKYVDSLDLPVNIMGLAQRNVRGKLILNMGYFLKANQEWLKW
jgi:hypothetical protein